MIRRTLPFLIAALTLALPAGAAAAEGECELMPRAKCFGIESVGASLSTTQAGGHPDFTLEAQIKTDPNSEPNPTSGLKDTYAPTRNIRFNTPPGLIGNPNVLGFSQQCTAQELLSYNEADGGCPNGSQIGIAAITVNSPAISGTLSSEPVYMMQPPGGEVVARLGTIAGVYPTFIDLRLRSESDYGLVAEVRDAPVISKLTALKTTLWGVPADHSHDNERCTPAEVIGKGCVVSESRPPGSRALPFMTNPTRCGVPLEIGINAASWVEPELDPAKEVKTDFATITGCNKLPFGPDLTVEPTSHAAASPSGADVTIRLPASDGVNVLEPSQMKDIRVVLPEGFAFNSAAGDGLATCSAAQVHFKERVAAQCPDASKLADTEFDVPVLERKLRGAVYLREPEPGNPFRIWIVADDLGLHVKLEAQLDVNKQTGQITTVTMDVPQAPVREAKLEFKSGLRAPLITPQRCGEYSTAYEFVPWSGAPPLKGSTPMQINEGCDTGGFDPKLTAGTIDPTAAKHSPFVFTLRRADGEQNPASLDIVLPKGLAATFRGIPKCEGAVALSGACSPASRIGSVNVAAGAGPFPLWVPQAGKRPTAVYLGGPYKGGPFSIVAVVPAQAGPFDFGDEVIRSAIYVDPRSAQATVRSDPFPQIIEGIPIGLRTVHVSIDRPGFTLNPTNCAQKQISAAVTSSQGAVANPSFGFVAANCDSLPFKPFLSLNLMGGTRRGNHPAFHAVVKPRAGDANLSDAIVRLPRSAFLDQAHIKTICTRVQFAADQCPAGSVYGHVKAITPLLDETLEGPVYLRSSNNNLPDLVFALKGEVLEIEAVGRIDSVKGGIRASFEGIPDAPVTEVVLDMQGGNKGLIVNSRNLCEAPSRANAELLAQNGRERKLKPVVKAKCRKGRQGKRSAR